MNKNKRYNWIPTRLSEEEFNEFILPHLTESKKGPPKKISVFKIFNYILKFLHTGCQWQELPIDKDSNGNPEIHYTRIFRSFKKWLEDGCFDKIFEGTVVNLMLSGKLDLEVIHGDGTCTTAKKGGII